MSLKKNKERAYQQRKRDAWQRAFLGFSNVGEKAMFDVLGLDSNKPNPKDVCKSRSV